jgi:hypothetical protein
MQLICSKIHAMEISESQMVCRRKMLEPDNKRAFVWKITQL